VNERAPERPSGGWVAWWYLLLGTALLSGAVTVAWTHLRADGLTVAAAGGLVGLLAGAAAVSAGLRGTWSRLRGRGRSALVLAVLLAAYPLLIPWCIAVMATVPARHRVDDSAAARAGVEVVEITYPAGDGAELSGWFADSRNGGFVVVLPGSSSTRSDVVAQTAVFAQAGYGVLAVDARGHGRSGGRAMDFGWGAERDVSSAIDALIERHGGIPAAIAVYGASLGGEVAIGAAGSDDRITAVVAEGVTGRSVADHEWLPRSFGWRGDAQLVVDRVTFGLADALVPESPPPPLRTSVAAGFPLLLITAGRVSDEGRAAVWIREGSPDTVRIWTVPGAGHTGGVRERPAEWSERVLDFLALASDR